MAKNNIKELSIQVDLNGLSFCILDKTEKKVTYFNQVYFENSLSPFDVLNRLKAELSANTSFSEDFKSVQVIHQNELSTLVPNALYEESNNADYLKFNSKILQTDFIARDKLKQMDAVNVYIPYVNVNNYIFETFGTFTYKHGSTIFIEYILANQVSEKDSMFLNIEKNMMEVLVLKNKKLQLYNRFDYSTTEDFLYYVLFVVEQLGLDPETMETKVSGRISKTSELFKAIYKYIRHVDLLETKTELDISLLEDNEKLSNNLTILNSF